MDGGERNWVAPSHVKAREGDQESGNGTDGNSGNSGTSIRNDAFYTPCQLPAARNVCVSLSLA